MSDLDVSQVNCLTARNRRNELHTAVISLQVPVDCSGLEVGCSWRAPNSLAGHAMAAAAAVAMSGYGTRWVLAKEEDSETGCARSMLVGL